MNVIKNLINRNTPRPVWWTGYYTLEDFDNSWETLYKAIGDARHNIKVAQAAFAKVAYEDLDGLRKASETLAQAEFDLSILESVY